MLVRQNFDEFIKDPGIILEIGEIANRLEGYLQHNYSTIYPLGFRQLINEWLNNFAHFPEIDPNIALKILSNLTAFTDEDIQSLFIAKLKEEIVKELNVTMEDIYMCPLGEEYESSFRLSALFNNNEEAPYYRPDINVLLREIENKEGAVIVFLDDFLFSGGQLVSIFKKLLGIKLETGDIDDIYNQRTAIANQNLIKVFKNQKIVLYYHIAFEEGKKNDKFLKLEDENELKIEIYNGYIDKGDIGCFGTIADIKKITEESNVTFSNGVFKGLRPAEVKPIYELLAKVGEQLLRNEHDENQKWNDSTFKKHALGYGGKAKLIIGQQNIPTSTLTSLWLPSPANMNKEINVDGKAILWKPLLYRKPKRVSKPPKDINPFPPIHVKKIHANNGLQDIFTYDLFTEICLNRSSFTCIYGHEQSNHSSIDYQLIELEEEFFNKKPSEILFKKKYWQLHKITTDTLSAKFQQINEELIHSANNEIGLILELDKTNINIDDLNAGINQLFAYNQGKHFSIIIDFPTRNVAQLKEAQAQLKIGKLIDIYINEQLSFGKASLTKYDNLFDEEIQTKYIKSYLMYVKESKSELTKILVSFDKVRSELVSAGSEKINDNELPEGLICDFEAMLEGVNKENWSGFYTQLLIVCDKYTPEIIEYIMYYAGKSKNDFIRFSALRFASEKPYLVDYWVEGTGCDQDKFINIRDHITAPMHILMYPLLRYYNRHKKQTDHSITISNIINHNLQGENYTDYIMAVKVLEKAEQKYTEILQHGDTGKIMKLIKSGVDLLEEVGPSLYYFSLIASNVLDKIVQSTNMSTDKIDAIYEHRPYLLKIPS